MTAMRDQSIAMLDDEGKNMEKWLTSNEMTMWMQTVWNRLDSIDYAYEGGTNLFLRRATLVPGWGSEVSRYWESHGQVESER